jgi:hypothetical protein
MPVAIAADTTTLAGGLPGDEDALPIRTDARIVDATLKAGESAEYPIGSHRVRRRSRLASRQMSRALPCISYRRLRGASPIR